MKSTLEGTIKKTITILVLLCMTATLLLGETLPDAPSATFASRFVPIDQPAGLILPPRDANYKAHQSFADRHRKAVILTGIGLGAILGTWAGLATKGVNCPQKFYDGKPYSGSSPGCPKPEDSEPSRKR